MMSGQYSMSVPGQAKQWPCLIKCRLSNDTASRKRHASHGLVYRSLVELKRCKVSTTRHLKPPSSKLEIEECRHCASLVKGCRGKKYQKLLEEGLGRLRGNHFDIPFALLYSVGDADDGEFSSNSSSGSSMKCCIFRGWPGHT
jgi:hypothetical protein